MQTLALHSSFGLGAELPALPAVDGGSTGVQVTSIDQALSRYEQYEREHPYMAAFYRVARTASFAASTYHGYKRNHGSIGWAIGWGALGALFPIITPTIAIAQGFGKPAK